MEAVASGIGTKRSLRRLWSVGIAISDRNRSAKVVEV
jgi:hypothetical protein